MYRFGRQTDRTPMQCVQRVQSAGGRAFVHPHSAPGRLFVVWTRSPRSLLSVVCERVPILERVSVSPGFLCKDVLPGSLFEVRILSCTFLPLCVCLFFGGV